MEKDIKPRDIMTRAAFENAMVIVMALGGSTNAVLHLLAMARAVMLNLPIWMLGGACSHLGIEGLSQHGSHGGLLRRMPQALPQHCKPILRELLIPHSAPLRPPE